MTAHEQNLFAMIGTEGASHAYLVALFVGKYDATQVDFDDARRELLQEDAIVFVADVQKYRFTEEGRNAYLFGELGA